MRLRRLRRVLLVLPLALLAFSLAAQQLIVHDQPLRLRHLAGTVVDPKGMTVPYALIELCDPGDQHVMASTFADGNGKFFFADRKRNEKLEIRISLAGYNPAQYSVSIATIGKERFRAVLQPAA